MLGTSFRAEVFEEYFGHGENVGVELVYAVEDEPLGTGGAIRHAAAHLTCGPDDPVIVFNGDVLTGLDIEALVQQWRDANADVALYLTRVEDPRAFGLVPTDADGRVLEFREKPKTEAEIVTDQINAGCYVFKRSVIDEIPADRPVSVERETFPGLLERGAHVIGVVDEGYWLDLGTPLAFAQGSADVVRGLAPSPLLHGSTGENFISENATVDSTATLSNGAYIGNGVTIGANAVIDGSVIFDGAVIGMDAHVTRSIVGTDAAIGASSHVLETVIADRANVGAHNELLSGARVFPDSIIPDGTIRFSSDRS